MQTIFLKPAVGADLKPLLVPDPVSLRPLREEGEWKPLANYWIRRLRDGDVTAPEPVMRTLELGAFERQIQRFSKPPQKDSSMTTPLVIVVGAEKGGVGKTTICRAIKGYLESPELRDFPKARLVDGQYPRGDLARFHPEAEVLNVTDIADQMKLFDNLAGVTIVDLPAGVLGMTLRACDDAMLLEDVRAGRLRLALLHVLGPSLSSLDEIADATNLLGASVSHFIVKNYINETKFFEWDHSSKYAATLRALQNITIEIPHLETTASEAIQASQGSIVDFISTAIDPVTGERRSKTLRGLTGKWLGRCSAGFDKVGLGEMIRDTFQ